MTRAWASAVLILFGSILGLSFFNYEIPSALLWSFALLFLAGVGSSTVERGMGSFVLRRLLEALLTLWVIATFTFLLLRVLPGGPFDAEKVLPAAVLANLQKKYHLDDPLWKQYADYIIGLMRGDLGQSYKYISRDISSILAESLPNTIQLGVYALLISYLIGVPMGILAGWKPGSWWDFSSMFLAVSGVALPSFLMAPVFILIFAKQLGWVEPALWDGPAYYVLPTVVLGIRPASFIARLTRASVLEVIHSDYIRTARAKGLGQMAVLFKHVLRNSLIPVLTLSGPLASGVLTGSFVIERIFAIPGLANHAISSVTNRDYPLILATTLLFSVILVLTNLITDLLMVILDPRVKLA